MSPTVAHKKRALRRELAETVIDPFELLADYALRNEELEEELKHLRAHALVCTGLK